MFNFFKSSPKLKITPNDKNWVENSFLNFGSRMGFASIMQNPFILPEDLAAKDFKDEKNFEALIQQMCQWWEVPIESLDILIFDDLDSHEWTQWRPQTDKFATLGLYEKEGSTVKIHIGKSNFETPELLVYIVAHEFAHAFLLGRGYVEGYETDHEHLTDLCVIFKGFGIFYANSVIYSNSKLLISKAGYLPLPIISYANALLTIISFKMCDQFYNYFNANTREDYRNDFNYLLKTDDTKLLPETVKKTDKIYTYEKQAAEATIQKNYEVVVKIATEWAKLNSQDYLAWNYNGYAQEQLENYQAALQSYSKAIGYEPYNSYAYVRRGYVKLKLGKVKEAYMDLYTAMEQNNQDSYTWLYFAIYYMEIADLDNAIIHLEKAIALDANAEELNKYALSIYEKVGMTEKIEFYRELVEKENNKSINPN